MFLYENPRSIILIEESIGNDSNEAEVCTRDGNTYKQGWTGKENRKCYHQGLTWKEVGVTDLGQIKNNEDVSYRHILYLFCSKSHKNYGFIARMIILFVLLHYRNRRYGNERYDKTYRYETVEKYLLLLPVYLYC